jgi:hypothetical protein
MTNRRILPWPTVPANNGTIVLFATHDRLAGGSGTKFRAMAGARGIAPTDIDAFEVVWHSHNKASAANGLRLYVIDDQGAWVESDLKNDSGTASIGSGAAIQVAALSAPAEARYLLDIARYRGFAVEYTAGADNPENWTGTMTLHLNRAVVQR